MKAVCLPFAVLLLVAGRWVTSASAAPVYQGPRATSPPAVPQPLTLFNHSCAVFNVDMPLDHASSSGPTFKMYYYLCDDYWREPSVSMTPGPIFLWSGSRRGTLRDLAASRGIFDYAAKQKALVVYADRRYFGWSLPDEYFRNATISYLTYEQSVQDDAYLVQYLRTKYSAQASPAVLFTAGTKLGVLARLLQPDVFAGVVASSAAVLGYPGQVPAVDPEAPYKIVTQAANDASPTCAANIRTAMAALAASAPDAATATQVDRLMQLKAACNGTVVTSSNATDELVAWTEAVIEHLAEEDGHVLVPVAASTSNNLNPNPQPTVHDLQAVCNTYFSTANQSAPVAIKALADALSYEFSNNSLSCSDITFGNGMLPQMDPASGSTFVDLTSVASNYLDCTGEGLNTHYPKMSASTGSLRQVTDMFVAHSEAGITSFEQMCRQRFPGLAIDEAWGARILGPNITSKLLQSSNMIFINGQHDANSAASVTWNVSDSIFAFNLPTGASSDFYDTTTDMPMLKPLRDFVNAQLTAWVAKAQAALHAAPAAAPAGGRSVAPAGAPVPAWALGANAGRRLLQTATVECEDCRCLPRTPPCAFCFREDSDGAKCWDDSVDGPRACCQCLVIFR